MCVYISYLSIVGCDDEGSVSTGVDRSGNQLLLLSDPNTGPLDHRHTQILKLTTATSEEKTEGFGYVKVMKPQVDLSEIFESDLVTLCALILKGALGTQEAHTTGSPFTLDADSHLLVSITCNTVCMYDESAQTVTDVFNERQRL